MNKKIFVGVVILIIAGIGFYFLYGSSSTKLFKGSFGDINDTSMGGTMSGLPDLAISSLKIEETKSPKYSIKAIINFNHTIPAALKGLKTKMTMYVNGKSWSTWPSLNTSLKNINTNMFNANLCPTSTGTTSVFVVVTLDDENQIAEFNESNNIRSYVGWCGGLKSGSQFNGYPPESQSAS